MQAKWFIGNYGVDKTLIVVDRVIIALALAKRYQNHFS